MKTFKVEYPVIVWLRFIVLADSEEQVWTMLNKNEIEPDSLEFDSLIDNIGDLKKFYEGTYQHQSHLENSFIKQESAHKFIINSPFVKMLRYTVEAEDLVETIDKLSENSVKYIEPTLFNKETIIPVDQFYETDYLPVYRMLNDKFTINELM
jgi:hypothetical protein